LIAKEIGEPGQDTSPDYWMLVKEIVRQVVEDLHDDPLHVPLYRLYSEESANPARPLWLDDSWEEFVHEVLYNFARGWEIDPPPTPRIDKIVAFQLG